MNHEFLSSNNLSIRDSDSTSMEREVLEIKIALIELRLGQETRQSGKPHSIELSASVLWSTSRALEILNSISAVLVRDACLRVGVTECMLPSRAIISTSRFGANVYLFL